MIDELRIRDDVPKLIRTAQTFRRLTEYSMRNELGHDPSPEQVKQRLSWSEKEYRNSIPLETFSIHNAQSGKHDKSKSKEFLELLAASGTETEHSIDKDDRPRELLKGLSNEQFVVMFLLYWKNATMKDIGVVLGVHESRVSQIKTQVVSQLRSKGRDALIESSG